MFSFIRYAAGSACVLLLAGCVPQGAEYIDEYDLVYTNYNPSYDFAARTTYALPDSVVKLTGDLIEGEDPDKLAAVYGDEILRKIRENMNSFGWTEVAENEDPDIILLPSAVSSTTISVWYPSYYWGWYYPSYGYGWYYPGYYPPQVSSYSTGSLIIQLTDPHDISGTDNIPVMWITVINALLEGSTSSLVSRIDEHVDQAFAQSQYLKH